MFEVQLCRRQISCGIGADEKAFPLDCPESLIPMYLKGPGRAMTEGDTSVSFIGDQTGGFLRITNNQ